MKSQLISDRFIIECECLDPSHLFVFEWDHDYNSIFLSMLANRYQTFWQRVKSAFKFVFKKEPIWIGDSLVIDEKRIKEFEDVITTIKKNTRKGTR